MTKEITKALCKFLGEVPSLTTMTTARIQTQSGKGFEFDFAELGYICSVINPILSANGLHIYHYDEYIDGQEILASTLYHVSGECLPTSRKLIPKGVNKNPLYEYGSAKTYFRRYVTLGMLNLWHGVDDAGLWTIVFPKTIAGAIFQIGIASGKFQGVMSPTTPIGTFVV